MGLFGAAHGWRGSKKTPLSKICHTYPTLIKLSTVTPYLMKIQKIYKSRGTLLEFLKTVLINMVTILIMSAKMTT